MLPVNMSLIYLCSVNSRVYVIIWLAYCKCVDLNEVVHGVSTLILRSVPPDHSIGGLSRTLGHVVLNSCEVTTV